MDLDLPQILALAELIQTSVAQLVAEASRAKAAPNGHDAPPNGHGDAALNGHGNAPPNGHTNGLNGHANRTKPPPAPAPAAALRRPSLQIVAAAAQLIALVRPPAQSVMDAATAYHLSAALRLVVEAHIVEAVREEGRGAQRALHVQRIGALTGVDQHKLGALCADPHGRHPSRTHR